MRRHRSHYNRRPDSRSPSICSYRRHRPSRLASDSIESGDGMSLARLTRLRSARSMISRRLASLASCSAANPRGITCEAFGRALSLRSRLRYCNRPFRHASMAQSGKSTEFFARIAQKTMRLKYKHNLLLARYAYALYMTQMTYSRDTKTIEAEFAPAASPHNRGECQKAFLSVVSAMILIVFEISGKLFRRVRNCRYAMLCDRLSRFQTHSSCRCTR